MRILILGSDKVFSIERYYYKYLAISNVEVSKFLAPNIFYDYYQRNLFNKLAFKLGISFIYKTINAEFKRVVAFEKPDLIWVFKGMEIFPQTLLWAKNRGIKLINYNPDNPFLFSGRGSGNSNISNAIKLYDLHFTYNLQIKKRLEEDYLANTALLPFGFDISDELYASCEMELEILRVCFLGNPDKLRAKFILGLANKGIAIAVYGHDWSRFVRHSLIEVNGPVYGDDQWKVLRRYRVQLNLMRPHNLDSHNMRTFEVPGIGGIMVAPDTTEHRVFFENGGEVFLFKDLTECANIIKRVILLPKQKADEIRRAARERSLQSGYSYEARSVQVLADLDKLMNR